MQENQAGEGASTGEEGTGATAVTRTGSCAEPQPAAADTGAAGTMSRAPSLLLPQQQQQKEQEQREAVASKQRRFKAPSFDTFSPRYSAPEICSACGNKVVLMWMSYHRMSFVDCRTCHGCGLALGTHGSAGAHTTYTHTNYDDACTS